MVQQWFKEAKLGIFIHWGVYAVKGVSESWSFYHNRISYEDYMNQINDFTAKNYNPEAWAKLFKSIGANYAVLTTKHHDGIALWDTKENDLSVVKKSPAKRDLVAPFCDALRKEGLRVGLYYSHIDWSHKDYATMYGDGGVPTNLEGINGYSYPTTGVEDPEAWKRFLKFNWAQLKELMTNFGQVDLLWFDGDWERTSETWDMKGLREYLHSFNPNVILNSRMRGYGDYETPEQGVPTIAPQGPWEFCVTVNDSWGYQHRDKHYKSVSQLVRMFSECIGMGGNMLLDIGPMEDGTIDPEQENRLIGLGEWISKNKEAIYPTTAGLPAGLFNGASTISKDRKTLYLFLFDRPWESTSLKGIRNKINNITVLSNGAKLNYDIIGGAPWNGIPGTIWIETPEEILDRNATVIKIELEGKLDLYLEKGRAVDNNM